jgi:acyl-CoA synthetase (AMP-forming)/AMP-acid ligase II
VSSAVSFKLPSQHLYAGLALNPDAIAAEDPTESVTYAELVRRAEALALELQSRLPQGSHIGLCAQNHIDHLVAHLAIIIGGFVWVPINPKNGANLNAKLAAKSRLSLLLLDKASQEQISVAGVASNLLRDDTGAVEDCQSWIARQSGRAFTRSTPRDSDVFGIKFTGGTTGEPKGVIQTHRNVAAVIANMQAQFSFTRDDCNLAIAPLTHGGSHYIFPLLAVGGRHLLLPTPEPTAIKRALAERGASVSFMPPTLIYKLLDDPDINRDTAPTLRHLTYSAAPMPPQRIAEVIAKFGPCLSTVYGQTEAPMTITAMSAAHMQDPALQSSVGQACRHSEVAVVDSDGKPVATGDIGEVAARGDIVMAGYFEAPQQTADTIREGWLLTGDLGYLDDQGFLFLKGRSKEMIISGGFNVYPAEVENALMALPEVRECAVFGVDDDYWGERVEAAVCLTTPGSCDEQIIRQQLKHVLGDVKTPKAVHFLDALPRNPVGKVVRKDVKLLIASNTTTTPEQ